MEKNLKQQDHQQVEEICKMAEDKIETGKETGKEKGKEKGREKGKEKVKGKEIEMEDRTTQNEARNLIFSTKQTILEEKRGTIQDPIEEKMNLIKVPQTTEETLMIDKERTQIPKGYLE